MAKGASETEKSKTADAVSEQSADASRQGKQVVGVVYPSQQIDREKLVFDKWMHRLGCLSGGGAALATGVLAGVFTVAAAPVVVTVTAGVAAGLAAFAVSAAIVRRIAVRGKPHKKLRAFVRWGF